LKRIKDKKEKLTEVINKKVDQSIKNESKILAKSKLLLQ